MADALVSPAVGGVLWAAAAGLVAFCAREVGRSPRDNLVPMMGVLGAFVFAAQMLNFAIPFTGSSGHLGGCLLLAILLGPHAAFLVIASVLTVQALFFADGGLLALGCNIFNLGFFPAFVAYPFIYRPIAGSRHGRTRAWAAAIAAGVVGLQLGALGVVIETRASGVSELPFDAFVAMMLPIHLAIGLVEGLATAAVAAFVARARPEALPTAPAAGAAVSIRPVLIALSIAAVVLGGAASWFASSRPDGLEWAIARITGREEVAGADTGIRDNLARLQKKTALLPDYGATLDDSPSTSAPWPAVNERTSLSGIVGGIATLALACAVGHGLSRRAGRQAAAQ